MGIAASPFLNPSAAEPEFPGAGRSAEALARRARQRRGIQGMIALIDLDWFKRINDAYGHPTGDEVLRTFAITTFANIRDSHRFGRYGGEEFLLVLPDTPAERAAGMLDRLRQILLARADSALYAAKAKGRNRIIAA